MRSRTTTSSHASAADLSAKSIQSEHPSATAAYEVFDYPGDYHHRSRRTDLRLGAACRRCRRAREVLEGTGNVRLLGVGNTFTLAANTSDDHPEPRISGARRGDDLDDDAGRLVPRLAAERVRHLSSAASRRSRPARAVPPAAADPPAAGDGAADRARGPAPSGDEITTDQYGRIKVKFFWDRSEVDGRQRLLLDPGLAGLGRRRAGAPS